MHSQQHHCTPSRAPARGWRRIPGHPDYTIRDDGLIASHKHGAPRILRPFLNQNGCKQVDLDGVRYGVNALLRRVFPPRFPSPSDLPRTQ